jgi:UDP-N-acetylmuramate--alanine ligase
MEEEGALNEASNERTLPRRLHFIGIGGTGMSGLALLAHEQGYIVSGSDIVENEAIRRLRCKGVEVFIGHRPEQVEGKEAVVVSSAIPPCNEELLAARRLGVEVMHRGDVLAFLLNPKKGVAIAGTHGKTTTTSMISLLLETSGFDPTVLIGGELEDIGGNAKAGRGEFFVAETDESDGSFLKLRPFCAVVTNIDDDHLEFYGDMEAEKEAFLKFLGNVKDGGLRILCFDHPNVRDILGRVPPPFVTYGMVEDADYRGRIVQKGKEGSFFEVSFRGEKIATFSLRIPGDHNVSNALACVVLGMEFGIPLAYIAEALCAFRGAKRRFEHLGEVHGTLVVDDYAHHPTEMRVVFETARTCVSGRVIVVFQPHRYTRTRRLYREMAYALCLTDYVVLLPIYSAGEREIPGVSSELIHRELLTRGFDRVAFVNSFEEAAERCLFVVRPGDILITMGAGDVWKVGVMLVGKNKEV